MHRFNPIFNYKFSVFSISSRVHHFRQTQGNNIYASCIIFCSWIYNAPFLSLFDRIIPRLLKVTFSTLAIHWHYHFFRKGHTMRLFLLLSLSGAYVIFPQFDLMNFSTMYSSSWVANFPTQQGFLCVFPFFSGSQGSSPHTSTGFWIDFRYLAFNSRCIFFWFFRRNTVLVCRYFGKGLVIKP